MRNYREGDFLSALRLPEVVVTGAQTALVGRLHRCSGTSADYTMTMPSAAAFPGEVMAFRMESGLTKFVTVTVAGVARKLWANETLAVISDGTNWVKLFYSFIPTKAQIQLGGAGMSGVAVPNATVFTILLDTSVIDNTGAMVETANNRIVLKRAGDYSASLAATYTGAITQILQGRLTQNGTLVDLGVTNTHHASAYGSPPFTGPFVGAAGDLITLAGYQNSGGTSVVIVGTLNQTFLSVTETQSW